MPVVELIYKGQDANQPRSVVYNEVPREGESIITVEHDAVPKARRVMAVYWRGNGTAVLKLGAEYAI